LTLAALLIAATVLRDRGEHAAAREGDSEPAYAEAA
jgi:hypothetical protein